MKKVDTFVVEYYTSGGWLKRTVVDAANREEAIKKARQKDVVIEIYMVRYIG